MKGSVIAIGGLAATALFTVGCPTAAAEDYSLLPVDPNIVFDATAYTAVPPVQDPDGQPGVETVFTHRDGSRQITNTILVLPDATAASAALEGAKAAVGETIIGGTPGPAAVGTGGTLVSGSAPGSAGSVSVLLFTEGNAFTSLEFKGSASDPVPRDVVVELGQAQDAALKNRLPT